MMMIGDWGIGLSVDELDGGLSYVVEVEVLSTTYIRNNST